MIPVAEPRIQRRLAFSLAAALAAHALLLQFVHLPAARMQAKHAPLLEVVLRPPVADAAVDAVPPVPAQAARSAVARSSRTASSAVLSRPAQPDETVKRSEPATAPPETSARSPESLTLPDSNRLRSAARQIIRDAARQVPDVPAQLLPATPEARLARAWNAVIPSEKLLEGGILKITTRWGTTYCLNPPADSFRGGPGEHYAIAVTCP